MSTIPSAEQSPIVSRDRVIDVLRAELRIATVVKREQTVEQVSNGSGVSVRAIRSYMANDAGEVREAPLSAALSIAVVLGPRCVNAIMALIGYTASPMEDADVDCPLESAVHAMQALGTFMSCAADKRIDHTEEPIATEAADIIIAEFMPFSSAGRAE